MAKRVKPNNTGVKTPSDDDTVSQLEAIELIRCAKSPQYFIQNYVKVQHPTLGSVLFKLRKYQKKILKNLVKENQNIILQPRQSGKTILIVAYILWLALFTDDLTIGIASNKLSGAKEIISRFRFAYEELPSFLKPAVTSYNKFDLEFDNGSRIISAATTENTFRGMSLSLLFLDEFAFVPPRIAEEFWTSILPTLSTGGGIIITSTPNGSENIFAETWFNAEQGLNGFAASRVRNDEIPGRNEKFKKDMLKKMPVEKYSQEFECAFISTKGTLINSTILETMEHLVPIKHHEGLNIFKEIKGRSLGVAVDVGSGVGKDYSVIQVFDIKTLEQVAEYRDNDLIQTMFTKKLLAVLEYLFEEDAIEIYFTIESNSIGVGVIRLIEISTHPVLNRAEFIHDDRKREHGMLTTSKSKMKGAMKFKDLVEKKRMKLNSRHLISELKFFVKSGQTFKAETGMNDDLTMACIVFVNMLEEVARYDGDVYDTMNATEDFIFDDDEQSDPLPFTF